MGSLSETRQSIHFGDLFQRKGKVEKVIICIYIHLAFNVPLKNQGGGLNADPCSYLHRV